MLRVEAAEGDVVGGVHDDGDDVLLADAHGGLHVVAAVGDSLGLQDLRGEVLGVGVEVAQQALEVGGGGTGGEGGAAPVVEQRSGDFRAAGGVSCSMMTSP